MPNSTNWLLRADNAITYIRSQKDRMTDALSLRGWPVDRSSSLTAVADAVTQIAAEPLAAYGCAVTVRINVGSGVFVPDPDLARQLLDGATVQVVAGNDSKQIPLPSLDPGTLVSVNFPLAGPVPALVRIRLNPEAQRGTGINAPEIRTTLAPGAFQIDAALFRSAAPSDYREVGFRVFDDMSFPEVADIVATVSSSGVVSEAETGYLDEVSGKWVSTSPIERAVPQVSESTGEIVAWNRVRHNQRNDLFGIAAPNEIRPEGVWPFNAVRDHVYEATTADGTTVVNRLVGIGDDGEQTPFWYTKIVHTTAPLRTKHADGSVTESAQNVTEYYFAKTALDAGYRRVEVDYIGKYHNSRKTLSVDGANKSVEYSDATGYNPDIGIRRYEHQANVERVNALPSASFDGRVFAQTDRSVSLFSYHDMSCLWPLIMFACGTRNAQSYIQGHTSPFTDAGPDSGRNIGATEPVAALGLPLGTLRSPDVAGVFVLFGIENLWGNIGTFFADVTNVGGRFWYQPDRTRWITDLTPQTVDGVVLSAESLLRAYGYRELSVVPASEGYIRALRADDRDPDVLVPAQPSVSSLPASSGTCYGDYLWKGTSAGSSYFVAAGSSRNSGLQLGPFCLNANSSWSYSVGNGWSARVSLRKLSGEVKAGGRTTPSGK